MALVAGGVARQLDALDARRREHRRHCRQAPLLPEGNSLHRGNWSE
jgi:hypothetical protein